MPLSSTTNTHLSKFQGKIEVDGKTLDVVCSLFADRVFLFISNLQKMGTLVRTTLHSRRITDY